MLAVARDTVVTTTAGGVVATVTIGGVVAPRHARTVDDILARVQGALEAAKSGRCGMYQAACRVTRVNADVLPSGVGAMESTSSRSPARSS